ncbi:uncharacterized protein EI97DRAFT_424892 [Westerdykella ornata]|uniref:F-box domain-containing protein n=1 Tax=Westerdykella ornata TaxID=318751 RepID=A0A6A6JA16_WESOR|nr:uncharacterized protein EI97DRAFT_424892 [Westerdykella ornata]KAF2273074.1 hypothetical protein EI97DRAFT_424892 [Westerdykella ornata]
MESTLPGPSPAVQSRLLALPIETLEAIIEELESRKDQLNLALTCSTLAPLSERYMWRKLMVRTGHEAMNVARALQVRPERMDFVHELAICYNEEQQDGIEALDLVLWRLHQVRHLMIEAPCPNNHTGWQGDEPFQDVTRIDYPKLFQDAISPMISSRPLGMLQSLTLHGHRSHTDPFDLKGAESILFHPTLRSLTISCANFNADLRVSDIDPSKLHSTPLESLTLIECNVFPPLLDVALSLPKALVMLSLNQRIYTWPGCVPRGPKEYHLSMGRIVAKQASSLETLIFNPGAAINWGRLYPEIASLGYLAPVPGIERDLTSLTRLKHAEVAFRPPISAPLVPWPDSLESIRYNDTWMHRGDPSMSIYLNQLARGLLARPNIRNIELCLKIVNQLNKPCDRARQIWLGNTQLHKRGRLGLYRVATTLKQRGGRLRIFCEYFSEGVFFIPPFLESEEKPKESLFYDSEDPCRFEGTELRDTELFWWEEGRAKGLRSEFMED